MRRVLLAVPVLAATAMVGSGDAGSSANVRLVDVSSATTTSAVRAATTTTIITLTARDGAASAGAAGSVHTSNPAAVEIGDAVVLERDGVVRTR